MVLPFCTYFFNQNFGQSNVIFQEQHTDLQFNKLFSLNNMKIFETRFDFSVDIVSIMLVVGLLRLYKIKRHVHVVVFSYKFNVRVRQVMIVHSGL